MSCISSNFSSFFLNSLNDSSEFAKYLSNGELKFSSFEDFQVFGSSCTSPPPAAQQVSASQQHQQYYNGVGNSGNNNVNISAGAITTGAQSGGELYNGVSPANVVERSAASMIAPTPASSTSQPGVQHGLQQAAQLQPTQHTHSSHVPHSLPHAQHQYGGHASHPTGSLTANAFHHNHLASQHHAHVPPTAATQNYPTTPQRWSTASTANPMATASPGTPHTLPHAPVNNQPGTPIAPSPGGAQHFDGSFEFLKYLRHSNDYNSDVQGEIGGSAALQSGQSQSSTSSLIDLDSSTTHKSRSSRKAAALLSSVSRASNSLDATTLDVFDHDSKHTIFDMHPVAATNSSNSNESSLEVSNLAFPSSHLNASNSNTSSEGAATGSSDFAMLHSGAAASAPKPLATFTIKDNFDVHPSHKVEEGIFQHMNKLPAKKKENLKQLGVRFTGQMTLSDKSMVVENFIKFCQEYDVQDHRPFLSLNQSGLNKADQIKFARYLGQGLPTFTLFCIYSNFKNLFCTKRTEIYTKDGYNLPYILDKTKRFLSNTTAGNTPSKGNPSTSHNTQSVQPQPQSQPQPQTQPKPLQSQPIQSQPIQSQPLQPQSLQPQSLQPQSLQPQSLQPQLLQHQPLQSQPLHSQLPKTHQTQQHPKLMLQAPSMPPTGHLSHIQQQPLHLSMPMPRDIKNMVQQQSNDSMEFGTNTGGALDSSGGSRVTSSFDSIPARCLMPKALENLMIYENFEVHETHRVEDGVCTHITRLPPKKQEIFKQFGIQSNQTVTFYDKYIIIENFSKFCNEYKVSDHRPFLDFHESGLPKCEQVKFVRYLGQGLPNLTLNKIYLSFKDLLGMNRIEKANADGYNLDLILKKKKKNLYNRMQSAVHRESSEPGQVISTQQTSAKLTHMDGFKT